MMQVENTGLLTAFPNAVTEQLLFFIVKGSWGFSHSLATLQSFTHQYIHNDEFSIT